MLSTSIKILWALLLVELHIHGGDAGSVKIGGFYGDSGGTIGDEFGTIIRDAINRVKNNRTLIPEPHGMNYFQGDTKPVNAVYTAIEDICDMINAQRPSALIVLGDKCPDCEDLSGVISHGSNPVFGVDVGSFESGSKAFKMYPAPEDMSNFFIDILHYFKWRAFTLLVDSGDAFVNFQGVMSEVKANDWNVTVLAIDPDDVEGTLVKTTTAKSKNILLYCIDESLCKEVLEKGYDMNNENPPMGSLNSKYTWILGNLDLSLPEQFKDQLESTNAYMTYFTMNFTREYQYTIPSAKSSYDSIYSFPMREKLAFDAVLAIGHALGRFVKRKAEQGQTGAAVLPGDTQMLTCPTAVGKASPNDLTEELMNGHGFEGMTGNVAFDENGNRVNYTITIFSGRGDTLRQLRGEWTQNPAYLEDRRGEDWQSPGNLNTTAFRIAKDRKIRIVSIEVPPFLFLREKLAQSSNDDERFHNYRYKRQSGGAIGQYTGNGRYEGYIMELMERIRSVIRGIDFEYQVELVPDGKYGAGSSYSKIWNGMVGEVVRGTADVAAGPITVTASRQSVVDFTLPFMATGIQALTLHTSYVEHGPFRIMYPFTVEVWFLSIFVFFLVALMIWAANRFDPYEWKRATKDGKATEDHTKDFTFSNSLWFCASTLFLQSSDKSPRSNAARCIAAFWYLYVLFMVFLYIVNVQFFITSQTRLNYIKSVADLKAEKTIKYGTTYKGSDSYHVFKKTKSLKSMWHKMNNDHESPYVKDLHEGVDKVRKSNGRFTLLGPSPILRYIASQKPCDVDIAGAYLHRGQYAFAVAKDSPLRDHISSALEALRDNGVLEDLERDWWDLDDRWNRCRNQTIFERDGAYSLFVNDLNSLYYMLTIGIVVSFMVFIAEYVYYNCFGGSEKGHAPSQPKKKKEIKRSKDGGFRPSGNNFNDTRGKIQNDGGARGGDANMWI
ncbi:glutamate receptor 3-like isoform X3 [Amphiura filiformis]|uniref:glutamate receptor 3-like isoform X3 n=1 Tax=Amphiura filiformis TaxID=82378 RepID=UPI003B2214D2